MDENFNGVQPMASQPSRKKPTASSYLVETDLDREWEQRRQQATVQHDSESSGSKEPLS